MFTVNSLQDKDAQMSVLLILHLKYLLSRYCQDSIPRHIAGHLTHTSVSVCRRFLRPTSVFIFAVKQEFSGLKTDARLSHVPGPLTPRERCKITQEAAVSQPCSNFTAHINMFTV